MNSYVKDTNWYQNVTRGFIDTDPPKKNTWKKNANVTRCFNSVK